MPFNIKRKSPELFKEYDINSEPITTADCPVCKYNIQLIGPTGPDGKQFLPSEGNLSMCSNCGTKLKFDKNLKLVEMDLNDIMELPEQTRKEMECIENIIKQHNLEQAGGQTHERK